MNPSSSGYIWPRPHMRSEGLHRVCLSTLEVYQSALHFPEERERGGGGIIQKRGNNTEVASVFFCETAVFLLPLLPSLPPGLTERTKLTSTHQASPPPSRTRSSSSFTCPNIATSDSALFLPTEVIHKWKLQICA